VALDGLRGQLDPKRLAERQELNNGFGNAMATAFELALTTAIFGFLGWRLDLWLGTSPLFLLVLTVFTAGYEFWKLYRSYDARMREHERKLLGPK
jgi:F0F1-type ATP synthase assembly protein I